MIGLLQICLRSSWKDGWATNSLKSASKAICIGVWPFKSQTLPWSKAMVLVRLSVSQFSKKLVESVANTLYQRRKHIHVTQEWMKMITLYTSIRILIFKLLRQYDFNYYTCRPTICTKELTRDSPTQAKMWLTNELSNEVYCTNCWKFYYIAYM